MIKILIFALFPFYVFAGGGGGGADRPGNAAFLVEENHETGAWQKMESARRAYCARFPKRCDSENNVSQGGSCGDVFANYETALYVCPRGASVRRIIFTREDAWTCTCYSHADLRN